MFRFSETSEIIDYLISCLPSGKLYNRNDPVLRAIMSGYARVLLDFHNWNQKIMDSYFQIDEDNILLDRIAKDYGLPNAVFEDISTNSLKVQGIIAMKKINNLITSKDFEDFFLSIGYNVKFYNLGEIYQGFPISFPYQFESTIKSKYTFWYWVEELPSSTRDFNNIGESFPIEFGQISTNQKKVKKILDFIQPDYLKFIPITTQTKTLYNL